MDKTRVVVTFVQVLEDAGKDFGFLCWQVDTSIRALEEFADTLSTNRSANSIKKAKVQGIPRQVVLKPSHAVYRLQAQKFAVGDRVTMVQETGGVPLAAKGVVVGLNPTNIDVVWDIPFISGSTLQGR